MTIDVNLSQFKKKKMQKNRRSMEGVRLRRLVLTKGNRPELNVKRPD